MIGGVVLESLQRLQAGLLTLLIHQLQPDLEQIILQRVLTDVSAAILEYAKNSSRLLKLLVRLLCTGLAFSADA